MNGTPPHFQPLDPDKEITKYRRNLPHWRQDGATYFVTFRFADAIPVAETRKLGAILRSTAEELSDEAIREWIYLYETTLDEGHGACFLKYTANRQILEQAFHHFDESRFTGAPEKNDVRYRLNAFVIMPNHAHVLVQPIRPREFPLETITRSWKRHAAVRINRREERVGETLWQEESYDRIVRDRKHLWRCLQYIGRNPEKAGLGQEMTTRWVSPGWAEMGWGFEG